MVVDTYPHLFPGLVKPLKTLSTPSVMGANHSGFNC